jgi:hypothetical protein
VIPWPTLLALSLAQGGSHVLTTGDLPVCSNRVINEVVKRVGCTLGDWNCWKKSGGFCADHVEGRLGAVKPGRAMKLESVRPEEVAKGDVAVFASRSHYAYVERVIKDAKGRAVAVDLSEFNFGSCWVDRDLLITDRFKVLGRRTGVALPEVDGGFLRPRPAAS